MLEIVTLAVLVYSGAGAEPEAAARARAALIALLPDNARVVDHAIETARTARAAGWRSLDELQFLARGRAALVAGRKARERVEHEEAARQLAAAEAAFSEGLMYVGVSSLAGEAALEHGVTLAELGRGDEARHAFRRALSLWAGAQLTEKTARPDVVRLFREVQKARVPATSLPVPGPDAVMERIDALQHAPAAHALPALADAVGADGVLVGYVSRDGSRVLLEKVREGCVSRAVQIAPFDREPTRRALASLIDAPCVGNELAVSADDPRLAPPPAAVVPQVVAAPPKAKRRVWPFALAGALGAAAAILGVTIAFVATDARYALKVDATGFSGR